MVSKAEGTEQAQPGTTALFSAEKLRGSSFTVPFIDDGSSDSPLEI